ncbi:MAG: 50S ribosome-binding GTPase [Candidatus Eremiobacteraeota bacterium]|nr:50S ribosome-binding GTPase [Candidatus Eremiobacteraeota bacterium]
MRALDELAGLIDLVLEVRDARVPAATAVAGLHAKLRAKQRIIVLNREDLADPPLTRRWLHALRAQHQAFATIGTRAASLAALRAAVLRAPRRRATLHVAVVGAPNTGKSSVINALSRRKRALAQDRAGVTRHARWLSLGPGIELLDTPGVLPPKIVGVDAAWQLAATGCLPETAYDPEEVVERLAAWVAAGGHARSAARFDVEEFARARGMLRKGGEVERAGAARTLLTEFRSGALGRFTFETPRED